MICRNPATTVVAFLIGGLVMLPVGAKPLSEASTPPIQITIESGSPYYLPVNATVASGTPIRWVNPTPSPHTVTHTDCVDDIGRCWFDSGPITPDGRFTVPSLPPGRYPYFCRLHPIMRGVLVVTEAESGTSQL